MLKSVKKNVLCVLSPKYAHMIEIKKNFFYCIITMKISSIHMHIHNLKILYAKKTIQFFVSTEKIMNVDLTGLGI